MAYIEHKDTTQVHKARYIQSSDPGAVGSGVEWYDTTTTPGIAKKRNAGNSGWDLVTLNAAAITGGTVDTARLGSGTADNTKFLRGDQTWATPPGSGAGSGDVVGPASATDGAVATFDGTTGKLLKNSTALSANVPATGEKAALVGTSGTPGSGNKYVTDADSRNTDTRTPTDNTVSTVKVQDDAVTNAKAANMATATIKGRVTAGTGDPEDLTPAQARSVLGVLPSAKLFDSTLGASASTIDTGAGGIASGYDVLEIWMLLRTDEAVTLSVANMLVNNDTAANYDRQLLTGSDTTASAAGGTAETSWPIGCSAASSAANNFTVVRMTIPFYTQTTAHKTAEVTDGNADTTPANRRARIQALRWRSTAAITRFAINAPAAKNFIAGSRLLIYGR